MYNFDSENTGQEAPWGSAVPTRFPEQAREQAVPVPAQPGAAPFAACLRLFRLYPLAVTRPSAVGGSRSMVLVNRAAGPAGFSVLTQVRGDLFAIRAWNGHSRVSEEIRAEQPVSRMAHQAVTGSMPVPHDGALLGWVTDSQVTALLSVHFKQPGTWDGPLPIPEIQVMPMSGNSDLLDWPPFAASPLGDERLWEYVERGSIVDIAPLVTQCPGHAFWVPFPGRRGARCDKGCIVITDNLPGNEYWLPAGVYLDHWILREGIEAPPVGRLLALPGSVDLACGLR